MARIYHEGELAVQSQAGVTPQACEVGKIVRPFIPPAAQAFAREQRIAVLSTADPQGQVWASLLSGPAGFLQAADDLLRSERLPVEGDPGRENLGPGAQAGVLIIDLATRRRMRVNGTVAAVDSGFSLHPREVYGNCPQYIHVREAEPDQPGAGRSVLSGSSLSDAQREWIAGAATFFLATRHPEAGADASHRGGAPGFVRVPDANHLRFPDYPGNKMFNSLGNIAVEPRAGLLFVDFETGASLQLTGRASVLWEPEARRDFPGAERVVEFEAASVVEIGGATAVRLRLAQFARTPPAQEAATD